MTQSTAEKAKMFTYIEVVWDIAHQENFDRDHAAALIEDAEYYLESREVLVELDKRTLTIITDELESIDFSSPSFNTKEAQKIHDEFYNKFVSLLNEYETIVESLK